MHQTHRRTYTSTELAGALGIDQNQPQRLKAIASACGIDDSSGSGTHRRWNHHDAILLAVVYALVRDAPAPPNNASGTYQHNVPYARAVADACARGQCPAYLIMGADDWLLIDNTPDADIRATDVTLHLTRQGQTVRVLHLRPILTTLERTDDA